jgi:hypothetical protein
VVLTKDQSFIPQEWRRFHQAAFARALLSDGTVFLGEMKTPSGKTRLVAIDCLWLRGGLHGVSFVPRVIVPGTIMRDPLSSGGRVTNSVLPGNASMQFGQIDPNDSSHVVITATIDGKRVVIDGWLRDNDTIDLEPAKQDVTAR